METGLYYNGFRYYSPKTGRYLRSDPVGLGAGLNTYAYAFTNPIRYFDPDGLEVRFICRQLSGLIGAVTGKLHCFVNVTCPAEGWSATYSFFATGSNIIGIPNQGRKALNDSRDNPNSPNNAINLPVQPNSCPLNQCGFEKAVRDRFNSFPNTDVPYNPLGPNSNSFAQDLITGTPFASGLPGGAPSNSTAQGIGQPHPNFP